jgi:hypothetical protein
MKSLALDTACTALSPYDSGKGLSATNPNLRSYATAERQNFHIVL